MSVLTTAPRFEWKKIFWGLLPLLLAVWLGKTTVAALPLIFVVYALCLVVIATPFVDRLAVALFWALPYMVVNLPTGVFTLKLPELVGYVFAAAALFRLLLRREKIVLPSPTAQVLVYLAAMCLSICFAPAVPVPFLGSVTSHDRNSPNIRPFSVVFWLGLAWLVVLMLTNIVGSRPDLYRRCLRAHILSSGLASAISVTMYILALTGKGFANIGGAGTLRNLVPQDANTLRLAGVAYEPLFLAFYLITSIPLTVLAVVNTPDWLPRRWVLFSLFVQVVAMLMTFSSGGWAGVIVSLCIIAPLCRLDRMKGVRKNGLIIGAICFVVVIAAIVISQESVSLQIAAAVAKISGGGDSVRKGEWLVGMRLFQAYPMFGSGPGLANYAFPRYHNTILSMPLSGDREINNVFLNVLGETGAVGMAAFGWCALVGIGVICRAVRRFGMNNVPALTALTASLFGCAVQYFSMNPLFLIYFSALVGLTLAAVRHSEQGFVDPMAAGSAA